VVIHPLETRSEARRLRSQGKAYGEILETLGIKVPKSTLATWFKGLPLPDEYHERIKTQHAKNFLKMRAQSDLIRKKKRDEFVARVEHENRDSISLCKENMAALKIIAVILHLAEGSKGKNGYLTFGNSDPLIIRLFVNLLRKCYNIDESKFRCTVQCRADQDTTKLETFWSGITGISLSQFYAARIDKRSIGKPTLKQSYKGVCRITYYSSALDRELKYVAQMLLTMGL
jgi:hypothetical protein